MALFVDLNVFIAIVTDDTDRSDITRELLNNDRNVTERKDDRIA